LKFKSGSSGPPEIKVGGLDPLGPRFRHLWAWVNLLHSRKAITAKQHRVFGVWYNFIQKYMTSLLTLPDPDIHPDP